MTIQICIGSSCHLKGSGRVVELFQSALAEHGLDEEILLCGCFCAGECSNEGVTVLIDDVVYSVVPERFSDFFATHVLAKIKKEGE